MLEDFMETFKYRGKNYNIDNSGYLIDYSAWDEDFAEGMAQTLKLKDALTPKHWEVISFIRKYYDDTGRCPLLYVTCRKNNLHLKDLKQLFPAGYHRGACRIAGLSYKDAYLGHVVIPELMEFPPEKRKKVEKEEKTYLIDVRGFLVNPEDWDENFAAHRAYDSKIPGGELTHRHWEIIKFLRTYYKGHGQIPTVYETCDKFNLEFEELEMLFPDGYHRGAVKLAGLRL
jgi:TusE/DsrC/DsvC family sulfur relay protein